MKGNLPAHRAWQKPCEGPLTPVSKPWMTTVHFRVRDDPLVSDRNSVIFRIRGRVSSGYKGYVMTAHGGCLSRRTHAVIALHASDVYQIGQCHVEFPPEPRRERR